MDKRLVLHRLVDVSMTVEVPEPLAGRLAAEAARLGVDPAELAVEAIEGRYGHDASGPGGTEAQAALASVPPSQAQPLVRATRPFFYGRWDEQTQALAASAETQSSKRA